MSIVDEITRLTSAKADIKAAIEAKGVTVPATAHLDAFPSYVGAISAGGASVEALSVSSNGTYTAPSGIAYSPVIVNTIDIEKVIASNASQLLDSYYNSTITSIRTYAFTTMPFKRVELTALERVASYAFAQCGYLSFVSLPNISSITSELFYGCFRLESVYCPNVSSIDTRAFQNCSALTEASYPNVKQIGLGAFTGCSSLQTAYFPEAATALNGGQFQGCTNLVSVHLPKWNGATNGMFSACNNLPSIDMPAVKNLGQYAFGYCSKLSIASFSSLLSIGSSAFYGCWSLASLCIPNVKSVYQRAFYSCSKLKTLVFGADYASFSASAFMYCSLTSLYLSGTSVYTLANSNAFTYTPISQDASARIYVPSALYSSYLTATNWTRFSSKMLSW